MAATIEPKASTEVEFDCTKCGACCAYFQDIAVSIDVDTAVPRHMTRSVRNRMGFTSWEADFLRRMNIADGRCVALKGEPGCSVTCRIYDRRPSACRDFEPGSRECHIARKAVLGASH